jgi:hypothetical protein
MLKSAIAVNNQFAKTLNVTMAENWTEFGIGPCSKVNTNLLSHLNYIPVVMIYNRHQGYYNVVLKKLASKNVHREMHWNS